MGKILGCLAFGAVSLGITAYGTSQQTECFNELENSYSVDSISDLSDKIIDDSGCLNVLNTLGFVATGASIVALPVLFMLERKRDTGKITTPTQSITQ